jgi:hypothetical protein
MTSSARSAVKTINMDGQDLQDEAIKDGKSEFSNL